MPETNYAPDPRPTPLVTQQSRNFGADVYYNKAPAPPSNRRKPAVSYTAAGAVSIWDIVSGQWVAISTGAAASTTPSEIGTAGEPGYVADYFDSYSVGALTAPSGGYGWGSNNGVLTGASIISATMADGRIHNRLALNNGSFGRKMPWGAFWNRIIIAITCRINSGVTFANTNGYIGVCSGTSAMVDSLVTANFVGARWGDGTGTSTFTAGTKISFFDVPSFRACTRRVNTTTDKGGLSSGHTISANAGYLSTVVVDISRPVFALDADSINYSVAEASTNQTTVQFSHEKDVVERILKSADFTATLVSANSLTLMGASGVIATPFAFDQSAGVLDTLNLYWPQTSNLEIASMAIRKIY